METSLSVMPADHDQTDAHHLDGGGGLFEIENADQGGEHSAHARPHAVGDAQAQHADHQGVERERQAVEHHHQQRRRQAREAFGQAHAGGAADFHQDGDGQNGPGLGDGQRGHGISG
jgi:hypothetical protein